MKKTQVRKNATERYLNALWHLYSKADTIKSMKVFANYHAISSNFGRVLLHHNYVKKVNGQYVYFKPDAPTIYDAKFILKQITAIQSEVKPKQSLPQPVVKKKVKIEKQANVWMYIAVISMFTTLVTMALVLLR